MRKARPRRAAADLSRRSAGALRRRARTPNIGFAERLVWFWSNHFCVSADKGPVRALCGAYEREAIRPHVLGNFSDMLLAVETHPAMLLYLDNARSIGPDSIAGVRRGKGLNENLAREILELHTLGVRTGYTQARRHQFRQGDHRLEHRAAAAGSRARRRVHVQSAHARAGRADRDRPQTIRTAGFDARPRRAEDLAHHPATAKHIATKLARHFVADEPPPALVARLTQRFLDTRRRSDASHARRCSPRRNPGTPPRDQARKRRANGSWPRCARPVLYAAGRAQASSARKTCSASRCGGRRRRTAFPTTAPPGWTAWQSGSTSPTRSAASPAITGQEPGAMIDAALGPLASRETREAVRPRRKPAAGAGAAADGARIPETVMS